MGDNGLEGFLKVCSTLPNLSILNFRCNEITCVGLKTLADFLQNCETPVLKVNWNMILYKLVSDKEHYS
jgi:hypothetical protein